jgi:hypothetical protein
VPWRARQDRLSLVAAVVTRRSFLAGSMAALAAADGRVGYTFWVFGLLHPTRLNVYPYANARLHVGSKILEGPRAMTIDASQTPITVTGPNHDPVSFVLEIPGVIRRHYSGTLMITSTGLLLRPIVRMDREVAVSSIAGAELPAHGTPVQALAAQALASRSFLCAAAATPRHADAQFCDTTHCQFLRAPAPANSAVERAVRLTNGLVLSAGTSVIPAHYSAACGGHTDNAELDHYRYRSVVCEACLRKSARRRGHGLGLCQTGAIALAQSGWDFEQIVAKYYPGCEIRNV